MRRTQPGIRKGRQTFARDLGCPQKIIILNNILRAILVVGGSKGDRKGRPYRIALPHVNRAALYLLCYEELGPFFQS